MIREKVEAFLNQQLPKMKIAVIGDIMVDRYIFGEVNRISPEAPVPVNKVTEIKEVLGGAANVANNLANLDCQVYLSGVAGLDNHYNVLKSLLNNAAINGDGIIANDKRQTTTKLRILGDRQQMLRLDFETVKAVDEDEINAIMLWLKEIANRRLDGIVISDYGKGVCTAKLLKYIFDISQSLGIKTVVDPKGTDWEKYRGATCITPNVKELSDYLGQKISNTDEEIVKAAEKVIKQGLVEILVVTRSGKGITVVTKDGRVWHNPATQQEVYDVSGAGDTVVASLITCLAAGLSTRLTLNVANSAAGIVVSKIGTYPIHRDELLLLWDKMIKDRGEEKFAYSRSEMVEKIRLWQSNGETVVFTNGCFDILHSGHLQYLREAAKLGNRLVIGVNSDESVKRLKGAERPINSENDRAELLSSLDVVDGVTIFDEDTPEQLLAVLHPNVLVKGGDYTTDTVVGKEYVDKVEILSFKDGYSTTRIIEKIKTV